MALSDSMERDYKAKYEDVLKEKQKLEFEFGQRRAQFRQLFLDLEDQLKRERETTKEMELQINDLNARIEKLQVDNEGIKTAAQLSEESKQDEFNALRLKYQEEIASLSRILQETRKSNEERRNRERAHTEEKKRMASPDFLSGRGGTDTFMSMLSNPFSRKTSQQGPPVKSPKYLEKDTEKEKGTLEGAQKQVQQDVNAWKDIVTQLEEDNKLLQGEVDELKKRLKSGENQVTNGEGSTDSSKDEKITELQKYLESEKSARSDLEMYVAVLNTQKGVLQEDSDKLRRELHNVCRLFEQEKGSHSELKQTWKLANEQFLSQQSKLVFEIENMKKLLQPQQLEQLSKLMRQYPTKEEPNPAQQPQNDQAKLSPSPSSTKKASTESPETSVKTSSEEVLVHIDSADGPKKITKEQSRSSLSPSSVRSKISRQSKEKESPKIKDAIFSTLFPAAYHAKQFTEMMQEQELKDVSDIRDKPLLLSSSSDSGSSDDDLEAAILRQNRERYQIEEAIEEIESQENSKNKLGLRKINSSNDILSPAKTSQEKEMVEKSLSQNDVSTAHKTRVIIDDVDSRLELNQSGWSSVAEDLTHTCMMCQNYEKQLQRLQKEYMSVSEKDEQLGDKVKDLEDQLNTEKEKFSSLEKSIESASLDAKSQINIYCTNQEEVNKQVDLLFNQVQHFQMNIRNELSELSDSRDRAFAEKTLLKEEVDQLKDEKFDAAQIPPDGGETEGGSTVNEERLKNEIMFLKDQIVAEKFDRETTEQVLQQDLDKARNEIGSAIVAAAPVDVVDVVLG